MQTKYDNFASKYAVEIPMIQRDYVQGADANAEKRNKFLTAIFDALLTGTKFEIDFIYGSSDEKDGAAKYFLPVDGQQRLTTLALVGWLLDQKAPMEHSRRLEPITYTTRPSTGQFCRELAAYRLPDGYGTISTHIKTVPGWFADSWLYDPSINAMLQMLDKADAMLSAKPYSEHVADMARCFFEDNPIVFEWLDMDALGLNDDLYIKMNARGKQLTTFENWKAEFEGHLKQCYPMSRYAYGSIPGTTGAPTLLQYFEYSIEHEWCDLLWPIAYERWHKLSDEEKRRTIYPRIDEHFMNLLDYVSRFIYFASLADAEKEAKRVGENEVRMLYERERDSARLRVYSGCDGERNVEMLFRILDTLVALKASYGFFANFFNQCFITSSTPVAGRGQATKVNLFDATTADLVMLCLDGGLQATTEVMLWAVLKWLLHHGEYLHGTPPDEKMTDYLRIVMGWARGRRQRLTKGLSVSTNLRLADYNEANTIIEALASADDVFMALAQLSVPSLKDEQEKGALYGSPAFNVIRLLSTREELYYCFNLLLPSLRTATNVDAYVRRFEEFEKMADKTRIRQLNALGYKGVNTMRSHYFYGLKGKWNYVFTIGQTDTEFKNVCNAFTEWMTGGTPHTFTPDKMAYYIDRYPDFIDAGFNNNTNEHCHYFIHRPEDEFRVWAAKTFSTQPIRGYNVDPYGYTVEKEYIRRHENSQLRLQAFADNSNHGVLWVEYDIDADTLSMECVENGWVIAIYDRRKKIVKNFLSRFSENVDENDNTVYVDSEGKFAFSGKVLLDLDKHDRIQTALSFLEAIDK